MSSTLTGLFAGGAAPPWLPRDVHEGRRFAYFAQLFLLIASTLLWFILGIAFIVLGIFGGRGWGPGDVILGFLFLVFMALAFFSGLMVRKTVIDPIDQGRFVDARNDCVIWLIIAIFIGPVIPGLFLVLTYVKLGDALIAQGIGGYAAYAPGAAQAPPPQPYVAPPPAPAAPPPEAPPAPPPHTQMVRCRNCNVSYPAFMHSCPNCGAPKA